MNKIDLAQLILGIDYKNIPHAAVNLTKKAIMDYIGVGIAGSFEPAVKILKDYVQGVNARGNAGIIGGKLKTCPELAAWVNGTASHALDYDDTDSIAAGYNMHPSVPILPAVFAIGEELNLSGKQILEAYIVGFEIEAIVGSAIGSENSAAGWHPTSVIGAIAGAAASAKAIKLNKVKTQMALGIAASFASGSIRNFGTMTKAMHPGNAARSGVIAAFLAEKGFSADPDIMNGEFGFCSLFSAGKISNIPPRNMVLPIEWKLLSIGLAFKPYPSCRDSHGCVDGALYLANKFEILPDQVDSVVCYVSPEQARNLRFADPKNGNEAKFSIPYCIGAALVRRRLSLEDFQDSMIAEPIVQSLIPKISLKSRRSKINEQEIIIELKNGKKLSHSLMQPKGDPTNPLSTEELLFKFRNNTRAFISKNNCDKIIDIIMNIENIGNLSELYEIVGNLE